MLRKSIDQFMNIKKIKLINRNSVQLKSLVLWGLLSLTVVSRAANFIPSVGLEVFDYQGENNVQDTLSIYFQGEYFFMKLFAIGGRLGMEIDNFIYDDGEIEPQSSQKEMDMNANLFLRLHLPIFRFFSIHSKVGGFAGILEFSPDENVRTFYHPDCDVRTDFDGGFFMVVVSVLCQIIR